jgi:hypothetical protein
LRWVLCSGVCKLTKGLRCLPTALKHEAELVAGGVVLRFQPKRLPCASFSDLGVPNAPGYLCSDPPGFSDLGRKPHSLIRRCLGSFQVPCHGRGLSESPVAGHFLWFKRNSSIRRVHCRASALAPNESDRFLVSRIDAGNGQEAVRNSEIWGVSDCCGSSFFRPLVVSKGQFGASDN